MSVLYICLKSICVSRTKTCYIHVLADGITNLYSISVSNTICKKYSSMFVYV